MIYSIRLIGALLSFAIALPLAAAENPAHLLAPGGTLRATFLGSNPVQAHVDPKTGEITGFVADITKELARRLGVPCAITPGGNAADVIARLNAHTADIGFLAYDEQRGREVDFAGPYALMFNAYIVRADSPIQKSADADRAGIKIAAVKGQTQEQYLSANIKNAQMKIYTSMPAQPEVERLLSSGELDAFGVNRDRAEDAAVKSGGKLRAVNDNFLVVIQEIVVEKGGDPARLEFLNRAMDDLRASGFLQSSLDRMQLKGVAVAPGRK